MISRDEPASTDSVLLQRYAQQGDVAAFDQLFAKYRRLVYAASKSVLGAHDLAEDSVGVTFLLLQKKAGTLTSRDSLAGWLYQTATNTALNLRRIEEGQMKRLFRFAEQLAAGRATPEMSIALEDSLRRLPRATREAILLKFVQGMTYDEIASELQCNPDAARMRVRRGLDQLSHCLGAAGVAMTTPEIESALERSVRFSAHAKPWSSHAARGLLDQIQSVRRADYLRLAFASIGVLVILALAPSTAHPSRPPAQPRTATAQIQPVRPLLPYVQNVTIPDSPKTFTLKYKAVERNTDDHVDRYTLTISYNGDALLVRKEPPGADPMNVLIHGDNATLIVQGNTPTASPDSPKLLVIQKVPIDPSEGEWLAAKTKLQAPPLTRFVIATNLPPVGFSLPNRLLRISLNGQYSWYMGGGEPTRFDAHGHVTAFGAFDEAFRLTDYREAPGLSVAGHIVVTRLTDDFRGPNTYDLLSADLRPLNPKEYRVETYRSGKLIRKERGQEIYVPTSTPDAITHKLLEAIARP